MFRSICEVIRWGNWRMYSFDTNDAIKNAPITTDHFGGGGGLEQAPNKPRNT